MGYTLLDHATDAMVEVRAAGMNGALQDAAYAAIDIMLDRGRVAAAETRRIRVESYAEHEMLYNWLEEIIYQTVTEGFAASAVKATYRYESGVHAVTGLLDGEPLDVRKHRFMVEIKAPTYHEMLIKRNGGVAMRFLMDL